MIWTGTRRGKGRPSIAGIFKGKKTLNDKLRRFLLHKGRIRQPVSGIFP